MNDRTKDTSRRDFLKTATVAGVAGALSACGNPSPSTEEPSDDQPKGLPITVAGYPYDRLQPLVDGRVTIEGCSRTYQ